MSRKTKKGGFGKRSVLVQNKAGRTRRVRVGSKAYERYSGEGYSPISGSIRGGLPQKRGGLVDQDVTEQIQQDFPTYSPQARGPLPETTKDIEGVPTPEAQALPGAPVQPEGTPPVPTTPTAPGVPPPATVAGQTPTPAQPDEIEQGFSAAIASGQPAPQGMGEAAKGIDSFLPILPAENPGETFFSQITQTDPFFAELSADFDEFMAPEAQGELISEKIEGLYEGVSSIDTSMMDAKNLIEGGTEDALREEITKASGFATEGQVQGLTSARNKVIIQDYNKLVEQRNQMLDHLDAYLDAEAADKDFALKKWETGMKWSERLFEYAEKSNSAARDSLNFIKDDVGWMGLYQSALQYGQEYISEIEEAYNLMPGQLQFLAENEDVVDGEFELRNVGGNLVSVKVDPKTGKMTFGGSFGGGGDKIPTGQFAGVVTATSLLVGEKEGKLVREALGGALQSENYPLAYSYIANSVEDSLTGESKTKFSSARTDFTATQGLQKAIQDYASAGGDMGLLRGKEEKIKRNLGIDSGKATTLAVQLWREFQTYRAQMTGAAFSEAESRDYASVNPHLGQSLDLSMSVIEGVLSQLENRITATVNTRVPGAEGVYGQLSGGAQINTSPESAPIGSVIEIDGVQYKKVGADAFEEI